MEEGKNFRDWLRDLRKKTGISHSDLAEFLGYSHRTIWEWESGKAIPSFLAGAKLATFFGLDLKEVFEKICQARKEKGYYCKRKFTKITLLLWKEITPFIQEVRQLKKVTGISSWYFWLYGKSIPKDESLSKIYQAILKLNPSSQLKIETLFRIAKEDRKELLKRKLFRRIEFKFRAAKTIYRARIIQGFTQKELAERAGISVFTLSWYERGQRGMKIKDLMKIAEVLKIEKRKILADYLRDRKNLNYTHLNPWRIPFKTNRKILIACLLKGWSLKELSEISGVSLSKLDDFSRRLIPLEEVNLLAKALEIPFSLLVRRWLKDKEKLKLEAKARKIEKRRKECQELLANGLKRTLTEREIQFLQLYCLLRTEEYLSQAEIARQLGLSCQRVSQIKQSCFAKTK
jgi:transcriptional regulator with XRE-family HTH domain